MIRYLSSFAALMLAGTACSAQQDGHARPGQDTADKSPTKATAGASTGAAATGPQGPVVAGSDRPVPRNSPAEPDIGNVAATTGRANLASTPPPFAVAEIGRFEQPFAMAFLPHGYLLVTEKGGTMKIRYPDGAVRPVTGVPAVKTGGQGGLLDVAVPPSLDRDGVFFTYSEPAAGGSQLVLARSHVGVWTGGCTPGGIGDCPPGETHHPWRLNDPTVVWRSGSAGPGGQFGARITFAPDGRTLFLTSGERQRFTPAQDSGQLLGKIVHLTLDGAAAPGNPFAAEGGYRAEIWTSGHRNPYGLVFTPDGRLWEDEMGPRGGDELNLIAPGRNYGWPVVSNGDNYSGQPIPDHPSRPDFAAPALWWNPSISPGGMICYSGAMFPALKGMLLIAALSGQGVAAVRPNGDRAAPIAFWDFGTRIRDIAQAPDGAIWLLEDGEQGAGGRLLRLTPR